MEKNEPLKWPKHKDHLNKTFLEEVAYKLWNTKGIRFVASERLLVKNDLSNKSLGFLSAYLIIYSLFSVYQISGSVILDEKIIAFSTTTLSILLLVFTQIESAQDYKIRAQAFHKCSLDISELHDRVRLFKTLTNPSNDEKINFCEEISKQYQSILKSYPNHDSIDYEYFKTRHASYYDLTWFEINKIKIKYYSKTKFLYHLLILIPFFILVVTFIAQFV